MQLTRTALLAILFSTGCKCRDNVRTSAGTPTNATVTTPRDARPSAVAGDAPPAVAVDGAKPPALRVQPLQANDDATLAALPHFSGATVVRPGRRLLNDTQWFAVSCGPSSGTFELLRNNLQSQGWSEDSQRDSGKVQAVTAQRDGLSVSIIVEQSKRADCAGATASITAFRLQR